MSTLTESIPAGLSVSTAPSYEPVTLAEAKLHLRVDHSADDTKISGIITQAREQVEKDCRRTLMKTTLRLTLDRFPQYGRGGTIRIPNPPLLSVSSITYTDTAGDSQTVAAADYRVDIYKEPGIVEPAYGDSWPATRDQTGTVIVNYIAGYSSSATESTQQAAVPASAKAAILLLVESLYKDRGPVVIGLNNTYDAVLAPLMWGGYS